MPWYKEITPAQARTFLAAWLGWVLDAFDFTIFLLVIPELAREFGVTYTANAGSITLTLLLRLAGGYVAGWAADRWGRKWPLMLSLAWLAATDTAIAFADSFAIIVVLRALFGFGMGAEWTAGTTLAMENWPAKSRGIASGLLQGSWAVGYLLAGVAQAWVVPLWGWRALFLLAAAPALLILPVRFFVPESPEWLTQKGPRLVPLRQPRVAQKIIWGSLLLSFSFSAYYALSGLYATLLKGELGLSPQAVGPLVVYFNLGMLLGAVGAGWLSRWRLGWGLVVPTASLLPVLPLYLGYWPDLLALGAFLGGMMGGGSSGVTPLLLQRLFPAEIRARATGLVYHFGAFGAAFVPMGIAYMAQVTEYSLAQVMGAAAGLFAILLLLFLALIPWQAPADRLR